MSSTETIPIEYFEMNIWEHVIDVLEGNSGAKENLLEYINQFNESDLPPHGKALKEVLENKKRRSDKIASHDRAVKGAQVRTLYNVLKAGKDRIRFNVDINYFGDTKIQIGARQPIPTIEIKTAVAYIFKTSISFVEKETPRQGESTRRSALQEHTIQDVKNAGRKEDENLRKRVKEYLKNHKGIIFLPEKYEDIQETKLFKHITTPILLDR